MVGYQKLPQEKTAFDRFGGPFWDHFGTVFDPVTAKEGHTRPSTASYGQFWPSVVGYRKLPQEIIMPDPSSAREANR